MNQANLGKKRKKLGTQIFFMNTFLVQNIQLSNY